MDENVYYARARPFGQHAYYTSFDGTEDPTEVLLRAFFMGGQPRFRMHTQPRYQQQQQQHHHHHHQQARPRTQGDGFSSFSLLTLMFLLLAVLLPILTSSGSGYDEPRYAFAATAGADQERFTQPMRVPYYVGKSFDLAGSALRQFEQRVEASYVDYLRRYCAAETYGRSQPDGHCARYRDAYELYQRTR